MCCYMEWKPVSYSYVHRSPPHLRSIFALAANLGRISYSIDFAFLLELYDEHGIDDLDSSCGVLDAAHQNQLTCDSPAGVAC